MGLGFWAKLHEHEKCDTSKDTCFPLFKERYLWESDRVDVGGGFCRRIDLKKKGPCSTPFRFFEFLKLAFRELEEFAGTGLAGLFAFLHERVACEETFLLERDAQGSGLAIDAANGEVVGVNGVGDFERAENLVLNREAGEVVGEITAVDLDGS